MTSEEHNKDEEYHKERAIPSAAAPPRQGKQSREHCDKVQKDIGEKDLAHHGLGDKSFPNKRRKIRRNALKHGLSIPVSRLPYFQKQIEAFHQALLDDISEKFALNDEIRSICYEIAIQQCELRRIAEMKRVLSSHRLGRAQTFSQGDIMHLITVIEGFIIPPRDKAFPFDARAMSMLYRIFGIRTCEASMGTGEEDLTPHQIRRLSSFERYETRASIRLRKAVKRLGAALMTSDAVKEPCLP